MCCFVDVRGSRRNVPKGAYMSKSNMLNQSDIIPVANKSSWLPAPREKMNLWEKFPVPLFLYEINKKQTFFNDLENKVYVFVCENRFRQGTGRPLVPYSALIANNLLVALVTADHEVGVVTGHVGVGIGTGTAMKPCEQPLACQCDQHLPSFPYSTP